jgi:putative proteasome-type protease
MKVFEKPGDRVITLVNSGNLAVTQATLNLLEQPMRRAVDTPSIMTVGSMWEVAELVGVALREVRDRDGPHLMQTNVDASANFIIGGQIAGEPPRLFMVYTEGNFIEATPETPYFQIGETKYGKPIIDRVVKADSSLDDVVKCVLVSFDSTMRSNLSVGLPIDLLVYDKDSLRVTRTRRFDEQDAYIRTLSREWGEGVRRAFVELPKLEW